jgi:hypothetical protein
LGWGPETQAHAVTVNITTIRYNREFLGTAFPFFSLSDGLICFGGSVKNFFFTFLPGSEVLLYGKNDI